MAQDHKSAGEPPYVAIIALLVSIGTACFSVYQWEGTESAAKRDAAIDFSVKLLDDEKMTDAQNEMLVLKTELNNPYSHEPLDLDKVYLARRYLSKMEYVAYLINSGRLDIHYVAPYVRCNIEFAWYIADKPPLIRQFDNIQTTEIQKLHNSEFAASCEPK